MFTHKKDSASKAINNSLISPKFFWSIHINLPNIHLSRPFSQPLAVADEHRLSWWVGSNSGQIMQRSKLQKPLQFVLSTASYAPIIKCYSGGHLGRYGNVRRIVIAGKYVLLSGRWCTSRMKFRIRIIIERIHSLLWPLTAKLATAKRKRPSHCCEGLFRSP